MTTFAYIGRTRICYGCNRKHARKWFEWEFRTLSEIVAWARQHSAGQWAHKDRINGKWFRPIKIKWRPASELE